MRRPLILVAGLLAALTITSTAPAHATELPCYGSEVGLAGEVTDLRLCPPV